MRKLGIIFLLAVMCESAWAMDVPPTEPPQPRPVEPGIELQWEQHYLKFTYDLSGLFDPELWRVLEENEESEITVEVRLLDPKDRVRDTQHHVLKLELLSDGKIRLQTSPRRQQVFPNRAEMLRDISQVRGRPIRSELFSGEEGRLEIVVLVNPVQVYSFPEEDTPLADQRVVPRVVFDRRVELHSPQIMP